MVAVGVMVMVAVGVGVMVMVAVGVGVEVMVAVGVGVEVEVEVALTTPTNPDRHLGLDPRTLSGIENVRARDRIRRRSTKRLADNHPDQYRSLMAQSAGTWATRSIKARNVLKDLYSAEYATLHAEETLWEPTPTLPIGRRPVDYAHAMAEYLSVQRSAEGEVSPELTLGERCELADYDVSRLIRQGVKRGLVVKSGDLSAKGWRILEAGGLYGLEEGEAEWAVGLLTK